MVKGTLFYAGNESSLFGFYVCSFDSFGFYGPPGLSITVIVSLDET